MLNRVSLSVPVLLAVQFLLASAAMATPVVFESGQHSLLVAWTAVRGAAQSGVQTLWSAADAAGLARGGAAMPAAQYLRTELGYGIEGRNGQWLPYVGIDSGHGQRAIRLGLRLTSGQKLQAGLELNQTAVAGAAGEGRRWRCCSPCARRPSRSGRCGRRCSGRGLR